MDWTAADRIDPTESETSGFFRDGKLDAEVRLHADRDVLQLNARNRLAQLGEGAVDRLNP